MPVSRSTDNHPPQLVYCVLDDSARIVEASTNAHALLGWSEADRDALPDDWVHPDDVPELFDALAAARKGGAAPTVGIRVRGRIDQWLQVECLVNALIPQFPAHYIVTIRHPDGRAEPDDARALRLEGHLWRIALEVQAAGLGGQPGQHEAWWADPAIAGLSERQSEILRRVVRGERAQDIARELVVAESTIRNHLSAIYRKFGVHSQAALMLRLMPRDQDEAQESAGR